MLPPFASVDDYTALFGDVDAARAGAALDRASTIIRGYVGQAMGDGDTLDFTGAQPWAADTFSGITVQVAHRVLDNPDGLTAETISGYSYQQANASADAYLTAQEKAELLAALGRSSYKVWTLPTTRAINDQPDVSPVAYPYDQLDPLSAAGLEVAESTIGYDP